MGLGVKLSREVQLMVLHCHIGCCDGELGAGGATIIYLYRALYGFVHSSAQKAGVVIVAI